MKTNVWFAGAVGAVIIGGGVALWRPWTGPRVTAAATINLGAATWSSVRAKYPTLARVPKWVPPTYQFQRVYGSKAGPSPNVTAYYASGKSLISVVEIAQVVQIHISDLHTVTVNRVPLEVATWKPTKSASFEDVLAAFTDKGKTYEVIASRLSLPQVERMALSLER